MSIHSISSRVLSIRDTAFKNGYSEFIRKYLAYISLALLIVIFRIWAGPTFTTAKNWSYISQQVPVLMTLAIAETFVITGGYIDLSVGSVVGLSCYLAAIGVQHFGPIGLLLGLATSIIIGFLNGAVFAYLKIPSFITTLATLTIVRAALLIISDGKAVYIAEDLGTTGLSADWLTSLARYPRVIFVVAVIIFLTWVIYNKTVFGRDLRAVGGNETVVGLFGISLTRFKLFTFGFVGFVVGLASLINLARVGAATPVSGQSMELDAISAVVLGGTPLTGGYGSIFKTVIGAISLVVLANGLTIAGVPPSWNNIVRGLLLIIAVAISLDRKKIRTVK